MRDVKRLTPVLASEARDVDTSRSNGQHQVRDKFRFRKRGPDCNYATHRLGNECGGFIDLGYNSIYQIIYAIYERVRWSGAEAGPPKVHPCGGTRKQACNWPP